MQVIALDSAMRKSAVTVEGNKRMKWEDSLLNRAGMTAIARSKELHKEMIDLLLLSTKPLGGAGTWTHDSITGGMKFTDHPSR